MTQGITQVTLIKTKILSKAKNVDSSKMAERIEEDSGLARAPSIETGFSLVNWLVTSFPGC